MTINIKINMSKVTSLELTHYHSKDKQRDGLKYIKFQKNNKIKNSDYLGLRDLKNINIFLLF